MQGRGSQRGWFGLAPMGWVAMVAAAVCGCGGSSEEQPAAARTTPVVAKRLERAQLVVWRSGHQLVRAGANGGGIRVLVGRSAGERPPAVLFQPAAWSPDGKRLAFTAQFGGSFGSDTDIYVMRADGSARRRLTLGGHSIHPVWSPDGRRIYFAREGREAKIDEEGRTARPAAIWSMRPDGSDQRAITSMVDDGYDIPGSFSPDGATLAFTRGTHVGLDQRGREANTREVWIMSPDGSAARRLAERSQDPVFSPDGRRIALASDRDENGSLIYGDRAFFANDLYMMRTDGSHPRRLTRTRALNERQPSWLPNGKRIAYQRGEDYQNAEATIVMQANADGSCARPVFPGPGPDRSPWYAAPTWRPGDARTGDHALRC